LEVGESFFDVGVIFLWRLGKEGNQEDRLAFNKDFKEPEKTEPVFKLAIIIPLICSTNNSAFRPKSTAKMW